MRPILEAMAWYHGKIPRKTTTDTHGNANYEVLSSDYEVLSRYNK
jgi:hypothetical protein